MTIEEIRRELTRWAREKQERAFILIAGSTEEKSIAELRVGDTVGHLLDEREEIPSSIKDVSPTVLSANLIEWPFKSIVKTLFILLLNTSAVFNLLSMLSPEIKFSTLFSLFALSIKTNSFSSLSSPWLRETFCRGRYQLP